MHARRLALFAAAISLPIAFAFSAFGAWPVLPFAGIEVAALWLALHHLQRHAGDEERIEVDEAEVVVSRLVAGRCEQHRFSRYWARVRLEQPPDGAAQRLFLHSHGRELEIGGLLTEPQKLALAQALNKKLGPQAPART